VITNPVHELREAIQVRVGPFEWSLAGVACLWIVMSLTYPFGWDQGILSGVGHVVVRGGLPYRDAWEMKGPAVFYLFALTEVVCGVSLWGIRIFDAILLIVATASVGRAASDLTDSTTGRWTAITFFLWYASYSYWHTAQPDGWCGMLTAAAMLPVLTSGRPIGLQRMTFFGVCVGLMSLVKPFYVLFAALPLLYSFANRSRRRLMNTAAVVTGVLLPIALCAVWFRAHGALDDLWAVYVRYPAMVYDEVGAVDFAGRARGLVDYLFQGRVVAVGLPVVIVGSLALWRTERAMAAFLVSWVVLVTFMVVLQGRFFAYQWLPLLPAAVLLGAVGFHHLLPRARTLAVTLLAVIVLHCVVPILFEEQRFLSWAAGRIDTSTYYDGYGEPGDEMRAVAWLRHQGHDGKVFVFGWNSGVAWLGGRETVSRFGFSMPLMIGDGRDIRAEYRDEVLGRLRADPPQYIIVGTQSQRILRRSLTIADFPALAELVSSTYTKVAEFGGIQVHERKETLPQGL
jgi:Dolichyl-phosphate-mannose-protein mannosyltransferase